MPNDPEVTKGFQEHEAMNLPDDVLADELIRRGFTVIYPIIHDPATGLLVQNGNFFDPDTGHTVSEQEAYKRASGGW